jgi:Mg2+/Co2+ transporter CorB
MTKFYVLFFFLVLTIPLLFGINVWHSNECGIIRKSIKQVEKAQEDCVEDNKTVVNEISQLLSVARLENDAQQVLGLKKMRPEDVMLIVMGGKGRDN